NPEWLPIFLGSRPFIKPVGRNYTTTLMKGLAIAAALLDGLGSGVDALARLPAVLCATIDKAPTGNLRASALILHGNDEMRVGRCDIVLSPVAGPNVIDVMQPKFAGNALPILPGEGKTSAHLNPILLKVIS